MRSVVISTLLLTCLIFLRRKLTYASTEFSEASRVGSPHACEQVLLGHDAARATHEHAHDVELALREVRRCIAARQVMRFEVEAEISELHGIDDHLRPFCA